MNPAEPSEQKPVEVPFEKTIQQEAVGAGMIEAFKKAKEGIAKAFGVPSEFLSVSPDATAGFMLIGGGAESVAGFSMKDWIMEPKIDGIRAQLYFHEGDVRVKIRSRSGNSWVWADKTANYPQFSAIYDGSLDETVLDGELVYGLRENNHHQLWKENDLYVMIGINGSLPEAAVQKQRTAGWARFVLFDIIYFRNKNVAQWSLEQRRVLAEVLAEELKIDIVNRWYSQFEAGYKFIVGSGGEGVVFKRKGSPYTIGRSGDWMRVKKTDDVVLWTTGRVQPGQGKYLDMVGSIEVMDELGRPIGFVSGITDEIRARIGTALGLHQEWRNRQVLVRHNGLTGRGGVRHARVIRWAEPSEDLHLVR